MNAEAQKDTKEKNEKKEAAVQDALKQYLEQHEEIRHAIEAMQRSQMVQSERVTSLMFPTPYQLID